MNQVTKDISVLVVEDEPFIARDLSDFLKAGGFQIQDVCYNAVKAEQSLERQTPDLCIIDINLGKGKDGIQLAETIREKWAIPFIFVTSYTDNYTIDRAKKTLPYGYISKPIQFESLKSTIEIALHNFQSRKAPRPLTLESINQSLDSALTPREFELTKDIYEGKTNQQLANLHFISLSTVKTHVHRIYDKFGCHTRSELIAEIRRILTER